MIGVGDSVVATRNGGKDRKGLPCSRPMKGRIYRVTGIYEMFYGLGCTLEGLDPAPYRGFFLLCRGEWYFRKLVRDLERGEANFVLMIKSIKVEEDA